MKRGHFSSWIALVLFAVILLASKAPGENTEGISMETANSHVRESDAGSAKAEHAAARFELAKESFPSGRPESAEDKESSSAPSAEPGLAIHYIDVGQGDAILIRCEGSTMLIDGGTPESSSRIVAYLKKHGIKHLDFIIASHAHEDHAGGLSGALHACTIGRAYAPVTEHDGEAFGDFIKYVQKQGKTIEKLCAGDVFALGGGTVRVLSPAFDYADHNNTSLVLKLSYGSTSFLFTGDANYEAEQDMLAAGAELGATVLKVGHHGSEDATSYSFLRAVMPQYALISCGMDNVYGHPTEAVLSRLRDAGVIVFRTDLHGTIVCKSDGRNVSFITEKACAAEDIFLSGEALSNRRSAEKAKAQAQQEEAQQGMQDGIYIGNINSYKFHKSNCRSLPKEENRIYFDNRTEALDAGFAPCANCDP